MNAGHLKMATSFVSGASKRVLSSAREAFVRLSQCAGKLDNLRHLHVLCEQESCSHKFWHCQLKGVQDMRKHTRSSLVLARALSVRFEGYGRTLPFCQAKSRAFLHRPDIC